MPLTKIELNNITVFHELSVEFNNDAWNLSNAVRQGNIIFDDTYLDIIAAAEVNVASGNDSSRKKDHRICFTSK